MDEPSNAWAARLSPAGREGMAEGVFTKQTHFGKANPFSWPGRRLGRSRPERDGRVGFIGGTDAHCRRPPCRRCALRRESASGPDGLAREARLVCYSDLNEAERSNS